MDKKDKVHNVFWTGGLDSSFRVIDLLLTSNEPVQPHYVVRHEASTGNEIDAMNNIRREFGKKYPELRPNFLPTIYINEDLIPRSREVDEAVEKIRETVRVHEQYQILAQYCQSAKIKHIDLTYERDIHTDPKKHKVANLFGNTFPFEAWHNPSLELTKRDCYHKALDNGWDDILNLTSFCRRPRKRNEPCGVCGPCNDVANNDMGFRLSIRSRTKARILTPFRNYYRKNYHKHNKTWLFKLIKRLFEEKF